MGKFSFCHCSLHSREWDGAALAGMENRCCSVQVLAVIKCLQKAGVREDADTKLSDLFCVGSRVGTVSARAGLGPSIGQNKS